MSRPALFLDRDGVINVDHGYVFQKDAFDFIDGIFDVARWARELGYKLVVVTNQAGIGRGYYSETDFHALTDWMRGVFADQHAPIDGVYFSPFHLTAGIGRYRRDDQSRKPGPGMLLQAAKDLDITLTRSLLIGDKITDVQAGLAAGLPVNLLLDGGDDIGALPAGCHRIRQLRHARTYIVGGMCGVAAS